MLRLIIGLENAGHQLMNDVIHYCQVTGHPQDQKIYQQIYGQVISQLFHRMDTDFQGYMLNLMELPVWEMIHYVDGPVNYEVTAPFKDAVRVMGIMLWQRLNSRGNLNKGYYFIVESCTESLVIVAVYEEVDKV